METAINTIKKIEMEMVNYALIITNSLDFIAKIRLEQKVATSLGK